MIAVHELAVNVVHHGAGAVRARLWSRDGALTCRVEDGGVHGRDDRERPQASNTDGAPGDPEVDRADPWPHQGTGDLIQAPQDVRLSCILVTIASFAPPKIRRVKAPTAVRRLHANPLARFMTYGLIPC